MPLTKGLVPEIIYGGFPKLGGALCEGTGALAKHGEPFPEESAEAMLERLLRDKGVGSDSPAPAWAMQMQSMFMSQHSMLSTQISDFHEIVTKQDCRIDDLQHVVEKNKKDDDARFQALSSQVQTLTEEVRRHRSPPQTSAVTPSGPTSSWRGEGKHNGNQTDTNFLHVIVGGWNFDSDRDVITRDLDAFLRHWSDSHKSLIVRTFVWGRKSRIANIILQSTSSPEEDRARFYDIQAAYSNKASNSQGNTVWLTPSKTPERRAKNRAISACREALAKLYRRVLMHWLLILVRGSYGSSLIALQRWNSRRSRSSSLRGFFRSKFRLSPASHAILMLALSPGSQESPRPRSKPSWDRSD